MPDIPQPTESPKGAVKKMALSEKERQLVLAHRAKTEVDRAFNEGLDYSIEVLDGTDASHGDLVVYRQRVRQVIEAKRRDV